MTIHTITHQFIAIYYKQMIALNHKMQQRDLLQEPITPEEIKMSKSILAIIESCRKEALLYGDVELDLEVPADFIMQPPPPPVPQRDRKGQPLPAQKVTFAQPAIAATGTMAAAYIPVAPTITVSGGVLPPGGASGITHRVVR